VPSCPADEASRSRPPGNSGASEPRPGEDRRDAAALAPPTPEAIEFIRFCRGRRRVGWPELYDEMVLVACRGLFHGYGFADLAGFGVSFTLPELPRLAGLVALVAAAERPAVAVGAARRGRAVVGGHVCGQGGQEDAGQPGGGERLGVPEPALASAGLSVPVVT
jgi:hypothetical protein